ncbi:MAG: PAS domain S-box protein [Bacillota bacterium]
MDEVDVGLCHLLNQAEEVLLLSTVGGRILAANRAAQMLYGYSCDELLQLRLDDLGSPDGVFSNIDLQNAGDGFGVPLIASHRDSSGHSFNALVQTHKLHIDSRPCWLHVIAVNDVDGITTSSSIVKTAAGYASLSGKQVDEIVSSFKMISHFATAGMMLLDTSGTILAVNDSLCASLGYRKRELLGGHFLSFTAAEDFRVSVEMFSTLMAGRIRSYEQEGRYLTRSGTMIWVRITATALFSGQDRRLVCICQVEDITAEKLRREELSHYAALVRNSDVAIYSVDLDGAVSSWNPAAERTYGYAAEEIMGQSVAVLFPDSNQPSAPYMEQAMQGHAFQAEASHRKKDGSLISVALSLAPIRDERDQIVGVSMLARDITEVKQLQSEIAQLERLNLVAGIAASIGHEVRNPMTTVRGYLQLMLKKPELVSLQPQLNLMIEELDRANEIISEFLSLARNKPAEKSLQNLSEAIRVVMPLIEAEAALRGNEVTLNIEDVPDIYMDLKEVRQLLLNLVRNGLEAMSAGGRLTISTYLQSEEVVLEVADQGCGIPDEDQAKLGTAFFTTKESGTGLGLLTCESIAAKHRAKITLDTSPAGSTFRVHFRLPEK